MSSCDSIVQSIELLSRILEELQTWPISYDPWYLHIFGRVKRSLFTAGHTVVTVIYKTYSSPADQFLKTVSCP